MTEKEVNAGNLILTLRDHRERGWDTVEVETSEGIVTFQVTHARQGAIKVRVSAPKTLQINIVRAYTPGETI